MDFKHLRYFVTLAQELHMGRAAEKLSIAQPALSQQIKALEERLDVRLFVRANRRLTLTQAGVAFEQKARLALQIAESGVREAQRTARGEQGTVAMGHVASAMFNGLLPERLNTFHRAAPRVTIGLSPYQVDDIFKALADEILDVAIVRAPFGPLPAGLEQQLFSCEPLLIALHHQHPLAGESSLPLAALAQDEWLLMDDKPGIGLGQEVRDACGQAGFSPQVVQQVKDVSSIVSLAAAGLGVGLVPASVSVIQLPGVRFIVPKNPLKESELWLVYRRFEQSPAVKKLLSVLMER